MCVQCDVCALFVWCVLCCDVCGVWCVARLGTGKNRVRVSVQNASVCAGKTRACSTHARVLPAHTEAF